MSLDLDMKDSENNTRLTIDTAVGNTNRTPQARLVVLGYEDPSLHLIQGDSPTLSKLGRSLLWQYAASCKWHIASFDVKTAFLRGTADGDRLLGLEPPEEMKRIMKLGPKEIVQLQKGACSVTLVQRVV